jgi:hypothetical protein
VRGLENVVVGNGAHTQTQHAQAVPPAAPTKITKQTPRACEMPLAAARSLAVPKGSCATLRPPASRSLPGGCKSAATSSFSVPSPPPATIVSKRSAPPSSAASATNRATSPASHVTRTATLWPLAFASDKAARTRGS